MRAQNQYKGAFTLVELLVVISVLTVLIAIGIPRFKGMSQNAQVGKAQKELATLVAAIESYKTFDSSKTYPPSTATLQANYLVSATPDIVSSVVYDPFGSTSTSEYNYLRSGNGKYYIVFSAGFSGQNQPTAISNTGVVSY